MTCKNLERCNPISFEGLLTHMKFADMDILVFCMALAYVNKVIQGIYFAQLKKNCVSCFHYLNLPVDFLTHKK